MHSYFAFIIAIYRCIVQYIKTFMAIVHVYQIILLNSYSEDFIDFYTLQL